jgi:hypothetical protein
MNLPESVTIPTQVMARRVSDETVILDLASGNYYGLDPVGSRFWQLLSEGQSPSAARDVLLAEYEVQREQLDQDLARLIQELQAKGLVSLG